MKKLTVYLLSGETYETDKGHLNFQAWGIDIITQELLNTGEELSRKLYIPYVNIKFIEEAIS